MYLALKLKKAKMLAMYILLKMALYFFCLDEKILRK